MKKTAHEPSCFNVDPIFNREFKKIGRNWFFDCRECGRHEMFNGNIPAHVVAICSSNCLNARVGRK